MTAVDLGELVRRVAALRQRAGARRVMIGIAGKPGAGKSTLAAAVVEALGAAAVTVPMDGFHLADVVLDQLGRRDRKGAPDTFDPCGFAALLRRLRHEDGPVHAPGFERDLEQPIGQAIMITPQHRVVVTEGNYLLLDEDPWPAVRQELDEVWWVEADESRRRTDLVARHVQFGKSADEATAWVGRVDDANAALVAGGRERADLVLQR